jgi:hypothetical protein
MKRVYHMGYKFLLLGIFEEKKQIRESEEGEKRQRDKNI